MMTDLDLSEVPEGWLPLVLALHDKLVLIVPGYQLLQAKEKFGELRYYTDIPQDETGRVPEYPEFDHLIAQAETASTKTCQVCGQVGRTREQNRWLRTVCEEHA